MFSELLPYAKNWDAEGTSLLDRDLQSLRAMFFESIKMQNEVQHLTAIGLGSPMARLVSVSPGLSEARCEGWLTDTMCNNMKVSGSSWDENSTEKESIFLKTHAFQQQLKLIGAILQGLTQVTFGEQKPLLVIGSLLSRKIPLWRDDWRKIFRSLLQPHFGTPWWWPDQPEKMGAKSRVNPGSVREVPPEIFALVSWDEGGHGQCKEQVTYLKGRRVIADRDSKAIRSSRCPSLCCVLVTEPLLTAGEWRIKLN